MIHYHFCKLELISDKVLFRCWTLLHNRLLLTLSLSRMKYPHLHSQVRIYLLAETRPSVELAQEKGTFEEKFQTIIKPESLNKLNRR